MNSVAQSLTGWNSTEAFGKSLREIFNIVNEKTKNPLESPVQKVIRKGTIVDLAKGTILIAIDGKEIPIDDSCAPIIDKKRLYHRCCFSFSRHHQTKAGRECTVG